MYFRSPAALAQERRLAQLTDDNAFVDVGAVLRQYHSGSGNGSGGGAASTDPARGRAGQSDVTNAHFLTDGEPTSRRGVLSAGANIMASAQQQHRLYTEALAAAWRSPDGSDSEEDEAVRKGRGGRSGARRQEPRNSRRRPQYLRRGHVRVWHADNPAEVADEHAEELRILRAWHAIMTSGHRESSGTRGGRGAPSAAAAAAEDPPRTLSPAVLGMLCQSPSYLAMAAPPVQRGEVVLSTPAASTTITAVRPHTTGGALSPSAMCTTPVRAAQTGCRSHHLCSVCWLPAAYRCVRCRTALFCSISCHVVHDATRCLKFTA